MGIEPTLQEIADHINADETAGTATLVRGDANELPCPNAPDHLNGEHCRCWHDCDPCCNCGAVPECPTDMEDGTCIDCGKERHDVRDEVVRLR